MWRYCHVLYDWTSKLKTWKWQNILFFSIFTLLFLALGRVDRGGNLELRHSVTIETIQIPTFAIRNLPRHQIEQMKILNISFSRGGIELNTCHVYSHILVPLRHYPHIIGLLIYLRFKIRSALSFCIENNNTIFV